MRLIHSNARQNMMKHTVDVPRLTKILKDFSFFVKKTLSKVNPSIQYLHKNIR